MVSWAKPVQLGCGIPLNYPYGAGCSALKQFQLRYGRGIRQKAVRDFSTKDNPGTLPVYVYEDEPEASKIDFLQTCDPPVSTVSSIYVKHGSFVVAKKGYCPPSPRISSIFLCRVSTDIEENSNVQVKGVWYAQDEIDPLLFTLFADGVISFPSICGTNINVKVIDGHSVTVEEDNLYE